MKTYLPFEIKEVSGKEITGHGSVFGNVDLGGDVVMPGAFKRSLATKTMPAMLWQHDSTKPIGIWTVAREDETGLYLKGELADTTDGRDARVLAAMGAIKGLSIGFQLIDFDFDKSGNRLIKEVDLWETSLVTFPMNPKAQIEAVKAQFSDPRALEEHFRGVGCSKNVARELIHELQVTGVMPETDRCDADEKLVKELAEYRQGLEARTIALAIHRRFA